MTCFSISAFILIFPFPFCGQHNTAPLYLYSYLSTIPYILGRQEYLGHTALGKTIRENFKMKQRRKATEDELLFFPNTHEAIIDQDTWDMA